MSVNDDSNVNYGFGYSEPLKQSQTPSVQLIKQTSPVFYHNVPHCDAALLQKLFGAIDPVMQNIKHGSFYQNPHVRNSMMAENIETYKVLNRYSDIFNGDMIYRFDQIQMGKTKYLRLRYMPKQSYLEWFRNNELITEGLTTGSGALEPIKISQPDFPLEDFVKLVSNEISTMTKEKILQDIELVLKKNYLYAEQSVKVETKPEPKSDSVKDSFNKIGNFQEQPYEPNNERCTNALAFYNHPATFMEFSKMFTTKLHKDLGVLIVIE